MINKFLLTLIIGSFWVINIKAQVKSDQKNDACIVGIKKQ